MDEFAIGTGGFREILDSLYDAVYVLDRSRRIVYWNRSAERLTGFSAEEVVGKCCSDGILMHVDKAGSLLCKGDCPAAMTIQDGQPREKEVYLHHREGHRVAVYSRITPLRDESGQVVGAVEIFNGNRHLLALSAENERLRELALIDDLTKVPNRRYGQDRLLEMMNEVNRYRWPFGILFIDLDQFKKINDLEGHEVGDKVLRMVARTLKNSVRSFDFVCRWGGEEFLSIIRNVEPEGLRSVAEKLRRLVEESDLTLGERRLRVTVSVGGTIPEPGEDTLELVSRADHAMYESKRLGGNRVTIRDPVSLVSLN